MRGRARSAIVGLCVSVILAANTAAVAGISGAPETWSAVAPLLAAHTGMASTRLPDGRVLAANLGDGSQEVEIYDPRNDTWTVTGSLLQQRYYFRGLFTLPNGKVLVAGGQDGPAYVAFSSAELYDPSTGTWSATGSLNTPRRSVMTVQLADGRVMYATGAMGGPGPNRFLLTAEIYDPASGTFSYTGNVNVGRDGAAGALLHDGRVLMTGGEVLGGYRGDPRSELWDPATGTWTFTGTALYTHRGVVLVTLRDGRVLAAGGTDQNEVARSHAELYDPATGTWSATGSMTYARSGIVASLLPDGRVLVAGGNDGICCNVLPSEIYDPVSGTWSVTGSLVMGTTDPGFTALSDGRVLVEGGWTNTGATNVAQMYTPFSPDNFSGFQSPLSSDPTVWNVGKAGRTYAVKWQLTSASGAFITDAAATTTVSVSHVGCPGNGAITDPIDYSSSVGGSTLRYDSLANQYIYNWASPATTGCYAMTVTTPDGVAHVALFELR